jgi:GT2 family glycosyltransferase
MTLPKVAIIIPHHRGIHPVLQWMASGGFTYRNVTTLIRQDPQGHTKPSNYKEVYERCSANREALRQRILKESDADWILSLDSDVLPPPDVTERLLKTASDKRLTKRTLDCVGGWIPLKGKTTLIGMDRETGKEVSRDVVQRYIAGLVTDDGKFAYYDAPRDYKTAPSDIAPLGCCLIRRELLERIPFESGCLPDQTMLEHPSGNRMWWGECLAFGLRAKEHGERVGLARDVICQHVNLN